MKSAKSPYSGIPSALWPVKTKKLIARHPLSEDVIIDIVFKAWDMIFDTKIGGLFQIGKDILPSPQVIGNLLHETIPVLLAEKYKDLWRRQKTSDEKDIVWIGSEEDFSIELKTSSHKNYFYGNASYGIEDSAETSKKDKSGYYLIVNFQRLDEKSEKRPEITRIRFGWIDAGDWHSQKAASGQSATVRPEVREGKLKVIYQAN